MASRGSNLVALAVACALATLSGRASAEDASPSPGLAGMALTTFAVGSADNVAGSYRSGGRAAFGIGGVGLLEAGIWTGGLAYDIQSSPFSSGGLWAGAVAGVTLPLGIVRVQPLVEAGAHVFTGLGDGLFYHCTANCSATLPYVGGRLNVLVDLGDPGGFVFGAWGLGRKDLGSSEVSVQTTGGLFGPTTTTDHYTIGGHDFAGGLLLGYEWGR